jgi:hypothetical protein
LQKSLPLSLSLPSQAQPISLFKTLKMMLLFKFCRMGVIKMLHKMMCRILEKMQNIASLFVL